MNSRPLTRRGLLTALTAAPVAALVACEVQGGGDTGFPTRAVDFTVPFDAGGSSDLLSRAICRAAESPLGESITLTNKAGANGAVGLKDLLAADADGYTLALGVKSLFAITPLVVDDSDAVSIDDFTIIATLNNEAYVLVVHADSSYESIDDLLEATSLNYGTAGVGTGAQLSQALLFGAAKIDATDVPFDGGAPAVTALLGKEVDTVSASLAETVPHIDDGKLRPLVVFSKERSEFLPDVPTAVESGHDIVVDQRRFVVARRGISAAVTKKLVSAFEKARDDSKYKKFLKDNYMDVWEVDNDTAKKHLDDAATQYSELVDDSGLELGKGQ